MDQNSKKLVRKFNEIAYKGWIPAVNNGWGATGLTFEKELGKMPDSKYDPDYYGIEIKCSGRYSRYPLYLFTIAFDGPEDDELGRITELYGWYDKEFKTNKVIFKKVGDINLANRYSFKFDVDRNEEKIYLCVLNREGIVIERSAFVNFSSVRYHLSTKLKKLAIIYASIRKDNVRKSFRYYKISLYKLRSFDKFLKLVENGKVRCEIISRIGKSVNDWGRRRSKNIVFSIAKKDVEELFEKYYEDEKDIYQLDEPFIDFSKTKL